VRAIVIDRYGKNDVVRLEPDAKAPIVRPRDVLIDVRAASVNPIDFKLRSGKLKVIRRFAFPLTLGCDASGVVREVGPEVTRFKPGDEVFARLDKERMGAFAEQAVADEAIVAKKPSSLDHEHAAALPLVGLTSWQALVDEGGLKKGQKVLIHAGAGGVGTVAIQLAKHVGAHVATTTSTKNVELVRSLGADTVVDYTKEDFAKVLSDYDLVFETLGGEIELKSFGVLKRGGVMVSIAGLPDAKFLKDNGANAFLIFALRLLTRKRTRAASRHGVRFAYLFMRPDGEELAMLGGLADQGKLKPIVDRVFALEETKDALAYVESGRAKGKVVIRVP
jgi:NADPH:quinone reductase-like Zn-dependent oxidoreductase